jgi:hypothetical protein
MMGEVMVGGSRDGLSSLAVSQDGGVWASPQGSETMAIARSSATTTRLARYVRVTTKKPDRRLAASAPDD